MPELVAEHLAFGFAGQPLLKDINLRLRTGEMMVCLGTNGSGKTTLLRLLSGLLLSDFGRVSVHGAGDSDPRTQIGILFQNPDQQMMAATVEEEIALGLELRGAETGLMRRRVDELLRRFQLEQLKDRPPQALSGGQKQRVALAAIMAAAPLFLLLDEPDSFLDAPSRRELMAGIAEVRRECGIFWTSPHPRRMPEADRYCMLENGVLREGARDVLVQEADAIAV